MCRRLHLSRFGRHDRSCLSPASDSRPLFCWSNIARHRLGPCDLVSPSQTRQYFGAWGMHWPHRLGRSALSGPVLPKVSPSDESLSWDYHGHHSSFRRCLGHTLAPSSYGHLTRHWSEPTRRIEATSALRLYFP